MREMKDSNLAWIGKVPSDWSIEKFKYQFAPRNDRNPGDATILSLYRELGIVPKDSRDDNHNVTSLDTSKYRYVRPGDFVVNKMKAWQGSTAVSDYEGVVSPAYYVYEFRHNDVDRKFFHYLFRCRAYAQQFALLSGGIREGQWDLPAEELYNIGIIVPPLPEQSRIANFLDERSAKIDEAIARHKALIEKLDEYRKAVITKAVTKGVRGKRKVRKTETVWIDTIPCDWEFKRFKFIANNLFKGNGITKDQVFLDGDTPCVRYGEIYSKYDGAFDKCFSLTRFDIQNAPRFFKQGDILFAGTGELIEEIGKNIIYLGNESCLAGGDIIVAQHKHNGVFLNYALNSSYVQAQKSYGKAKLKVVHISASEIGDLLVALPPKDEQSEITAFLDKKCAAIDGAKERHQQLIVKLEEYKKSLIYNAVTGKIEC